MSNLPLSSGYRHESGVNTGYSGSVAWWAWERLRFLVFLVGDGLAAYQLVGGVMAYQGGDG